MYYRFELNKNKYDEFYSQYEQYFRKHFYPVPYLFTYYSDINKLFWSENIYCFKKYKFVPDNLEFIYITYCYEVYLIQNIDKFRLLDKIGKLFIFPLLSFIISIFLFYYSLSFYGYIAIFFSILSNFCIKIYEANIKTMDEKAKKISNDEIIEIITPYIKKIKDTDLLLKKYNLKNKNFSSVNEETHHINKSNTDNKIVKEEFQLRFKSELRKNIDNIVKNNKFTNDELQSITNFSYSSILSNKEVMKKIFDNSNIDYRNIMDNFEIKEEKRLKNHLSYEGRISVKDKRILKEKLGYTCQSCGLKMSEKYGNIGSNYIELHHKIPYSQLKENDSRELQVADFCALCPNCHRMIHRLENADDIELLSEIVKSNK